MELEFIKLINLAVQGMSYKLGMSYEQALAECTVRELLLYAAMCADIPMPQQPEPPDDLEKEVAEFSSYVRKSL